MADPVISCVLTGASGTLDLNSGPAYELESSSFEEVSTSWRRHTVEGEWVEGAYTIGAVRENVARPLAVWVYGDNESQYKAREEALKTALGQLTFTLSFTIDGVGSTWRCEVADFAVRREQGLLWARQGLVRAQVPTRPTPIA